MQARLAARRLRQLAQSPAAALLGPRQCGKTTLARIELAPFLLPELGEKALDRLWIAGGYPGGGNLRKRLVKSPKVYIRDSGLLHALLGVASRAELLRHPRAGASWEGLVIEQILGSLSTMGIDAQEHVFRSSDGHEIDLVLKIGPVSVALEVKLAAGASEHDMARLDRAADLVHAEHRYLICRTSAPATGATRGVLTLAAAIQRLGQLGRTAARARRRLR